MPELGNNTIMFVMQTIGHPRDSKRIKMLIDAGFVVEAVGFSRNSHIGRNPDCKVDVIGKISDGNYFRRIVVLLASLNKLQRRVCKSQIIYVSGFDMLFLIFMVKKLYKLSFSLIYEIGDIRDIQTKSSILGRFTRWLDRLLIRQVDLVVATSIGYIKGYYNDWLGENPKYHIIENKLEFKFEDQKNIYPVVKKTKITIGYFGVLRCIRSIEILCMLAKSQPDNFRVIVAGVFQDESYKRLITDVPNIKYYGTYESPNDLQKLYSDVDIVWACYPFPADEDQNWKWARTNRFYESCYYSTPMIFLKGSGDEKSILKYEIGMPIQDQNDDKVLDQFSLLNWSNIEKWNKAIKDVPQSVFVFGAEREEIKDKIINLCNNQS